MRSYLIVFVVAGRVAQPSAWHNREAGAPSFAFFAKGGCQNDGTARAPPPDLASPDCGA